MKTSVDFEAFSQRLREARKKDGRTYIELASATSINSSELLSWAAGDIVAGPTDAQIGRLALALKMDPVELAPVTSSSKSRPWSDGPWNIYVSDDTGAIKIESYHGVPVTSAVDIRLIEMAPKLADTVHYFCEMLKTLVQKAGAPLPKADLELTDSLLSYIRSGGEEAEERLGRAAIARGKFNGSRTGGDQ